LAPGRLDLVARDLTDRFAPSETLPDVEPGRSDVVLRLRAGGEIRGRVVDERTGDPAACELMLTPDASNAHRSSGSMSFGSQPDGTFARSGLEWGAYGLAARTNDGRFGIAAGIQVKEGAEPQEVSVALRPGGELVLRYEGHRAQVRVVVLSDGVPFDWPRDLESGKPWELLAPAGSLQIECRAERVSEPKVTDVHLGAGERKEVVLDDRR